MGAIESLTILSATGPSSVSVSCVINSGADCEKTEATLTMSLWRSQPADYAPESRAVILALPKKRPFLPGDFEAKGKKAVFSSLLHVPSVSHERKDQRGFFLARASEILEPDRTSWQGAGFSRVELVND